MQKPELQLMRYFIEMAYNGTAYHGWQRQDNAVSVQSVLEDSLSTLLRHDISVTGAGRTDTGVHASYYVAHFDSEEIENTVSFVYHLNSILPHNIAVYNITTVSGESHARFDAFEREYKYFMTTRKDPFRRETAWYYRGSLDLTSMNHAAALLLSCDDFTTFCKLHSDNKTNICKITHALWVQSGPELIFTIRSDRFLRNMVRSLTGTLVEVGKGKIGIGEFKEALEARDLRRAGPTAPAEGLFLSDVRYPEDIFKRTIH